MEFSDGSRPVTKQRELQLADEEAFSLCTEMLLLARNELYVNMHFLDLALSAFRFQPDWTLCARGDGNGRGIATDAAAIYVQPDWLIPFYQKKGRVYLNRAYLHAVIHCLFCHFAGRGGRNRALWDLASDIAAEYLIDEMTSPAVHLPRVPKKQALYEKLRAGGLRFFNAENIYAALLSEGMAEAERAAYSELFAADNHALWEDGDERERPRIANERRTQWKDLREKMQTALETGSKDAGSGNGSLHEALAVENRERYSFREFLRRFCILREEARVDEDSFDPIFYTYGLTHYGNMPLIEPLETKELFAVEEFVIVIDTSYSTSGALVRRFLEQCYDVLTERNSYFRKVNIRVIQCDERVQADQLITSREELAAYMRSFRLIGGGGTDFRPAFAYVDGLIRQKKFRRLKGMLYFTDGKGIYPAKRPPYEVAFVFLEDQYDDADVPGFAMKLVIRREELEAGDER